MDKKTGKQLAAKAARILSNPYKLTLDEIPEVLTSFAGCILAQYEKDKLEGIVPKTAAFEKVEKKAK